MRQLIFTSGVGIAEAVYTATVPSSTPSVPPPPAEPSRIILPVTGRHPRTTSCGATDWNAPGGMPPVGMPPVEMPQWECPVGMPPAGMPPGMPPAGMLPAGRWEAIDALSEHASDASDVSKHANYASELSDAARDADGYDATQFTTNVLRCGHAGDGGSGMMLHRAVNQHAPPPPQGGPQMWPQQGQQQQPPHQQPVAAPRTWSIESPGLDGEEVNRRISAPQQQHHISASAPWGRRKRSEIRDVSSSSAVETSVRAGSCVFWFALSGVFCHFTQRRAL